MRTTMIITGVIIAFLGTFYIMARARMKNIPVVADNEKILTLTDKNFQHQTKNRLVLVDFWASWCAPCRMMAPVLNEVAAELTGNSHVGKVNIEQYQSLAQKFQVRNIPTLILFKNGKEINRFVGIKSKDFLLQQISNTMIIDAIPGVTKKYHLKMKKVLILGGGFAGIQTAIELQKKKIFEITLVSERDYLYLYPISIWIPVHIKEFDDVKIPLSEIQKKYPFNLIVDRVSEIHASENKVICENNTLTYDYLVVAFGAEKMQHKGIVNTLSICAKPEMALDIRNRIDELILKKSGKIAIGFGGNPNDKSAVRGGPAFELMFNIHNYLKNKKLRDNFELTFFAPMDEPGARMGKGALAMIDKMFTAIISKNNLVKR